MGKREPGIYGSKSFETYFKELQEQFKDVTLEYFQSNHEGDLLDKLYEVNEKQYLGVVFNAGAYTHTSIALHDCIKGIKIPVIEVHISNVAAREDYRKISYISDVCIGSIIGFGLDSYKMAIEHFVGKIENKAERFLEIICPNSKSELQRAILIAACKSKGTSTIISNIEEPFCDDVISAINAINSLAQIEESIIEYNSQYKQLNVKGIDLVNNEDLHFQTINVGESGTLLRMLIGIIMVSSSRITFKREGSLAKRKLDYAIELAKIFGGSVAFENAGSGINVVGCCFETRPLAHKEISYSNFVVDGTESSQYISGLLIGIAYSNKFKNHIGLKVTNMTSKGYIDITLKMLRDFGKYYNCSDDAEGKIFIYENENELAEQPLTRVVINPDFSSIAALMTAIYALEIKKPIKFVQENPIGYSGNIEECEQPDKIFGDLLRPALDISKIYYSNAIEVLYKSNELAQVLVPLIDNPDLFPYLAVVGALSNGSVYKLRGLERLINKESNRALAIVTEFEKLGIKTNSYTNDIEKTTLVIYPHDSNIIIPEDYIIKTHNDHRIAMALAILVLAKTNDFNRIKFDNEECLNKSYPNFMEHLRKLFDYKNA